MKVYVASFLFYSYVFFLCHFMRILVKKFIFNSDIQEQLLEFISTVQVCAPIFDVGIIWDTYGLTGVFCEIFLLELLNCLTLDEKCCANPLILLNHYRRPPDGEKVNALWCLLSFFTQILGAYVSFKLSRLFWAYRLIEEQGNLFDVGSACLSDLAVSVAAGSLYEGIATLVCHLIELRVENFSTGFQPVINSFSSAFACILGIHLTGMYCNPISASACNFNCEGTDLKGHVIVYWLGPLSGWLLAEKIDENLQKFL